MDTTDRGQDVLMVPDGPRVRLRSAGDRSIEEIPCAEIALLMQVLEKEETFAGPEDLYRRVLECYGIKRLTTNIQSRLAKIHDSRDRLIDVG